MCLLFAFVVCEFKRRRGVLVSPQCIMLISVPVRSVCLAVLRDITERGRDLEQVLSQYITFVKPAFEEFCLPVSNCVFFSHTFLFLIQW